MNGSGGKVAQDTDTYIEHCKHGVFSDCSENKATSNTRQNLCSTSQNYMTSTQTH